MEDTRSGMRRFVLHGIGLFYLISTVCAAIAVRGLPAGEAPMGYLAPIGLSMIAITTLFAAIRRYRGGAWFVAATLSATIAFIFMSVIYDGYRQGNTATVGGGAIMALLCWLLTGLLSWFGHRRHLRICHSLDPNAPAELIDASSPENSEVPEYSQPLLYPPTKNWRVFLLLIFSATLYSLFLTYRIVKDLHELGEKHLNPKRCAWQMLIPLYNFSVFLTIAKHVKRLSLDNGITWRFSPAVLVTVLILANISSVATPSFLFLLNCSITSIPWLILNDKMNRLRLCQPSNWREPVDRYSWRQYGVFILGVPFMAMALLGSKSELAYYTAERLDAQQTLADKTGGYEVTMPSGNWRRLASHTLYPDTDLELQNKSLNEWVVVRVRANEQQSLDNVVDQRQAIISSSWRQFEVEETRNFAPGTDLIPISLAQYIQQGGIPSLDSPLFVATLVTPESVFEAIGHGSKTQEGGAWELIKSFRLIAPEKKS